MSEPKRMTIPDTQESDWVCGACACIGIKDLGSEKDAFTAMERFCELKLNPPKTRYGGSSYNILECFFVFVAGPEKPGHYHSKKWVKYGTEFATFITDHNLGKLTTLGKAVNEKFHRSEQTTAQVWLWKPDRDALIAWWEARDNSKNENVEQLCLT